MWEQLKRWARELKNEGMTLWFCCRHPDMPWLPKILAIMVVGYFLSPIDLIPDFIPVIGYLDDVILVPIGIYFTLKLVPRHVIEECRAKARDWIAARQPKPKSIIAAVVIMVLWILFFALLWQYFGADVMRLLGAA
jgi:uncharacterized membrane protein YkvA (DUF1232 family)